MVIKKMDLIGFLKANENVRKIFGQRELKIIEKQLSGINLTQSEKNRLSRDIRKKFEVIEKLSRFEDEFKLKKGGKIKRLIEKVKKEILNSEWKNKVKEIWLFGSSVTGERSVRSDIDIVVLFKKDLDNKETTRFRLRISREFSKQIDIQVFNNLPEKIQKSILKNHKVLWKSG